MKSELPKLSKMQKQEGLKKFRTLPAKHRLEILALMLETRQQKLKNQ